MTIQLERSSRHDDLMTLISGQASGTAWKRPSTPARTSSTWTCPPSSRSTGCSWPPRRSCPRPGDFVTVEVGPSSVIIVRDDDEQVRAFHNVCRHRGSRILDEERAASATWCARITTGPTESTEACGTPTTSRPRSTAAASASSRSSAQRRRPGVHLPR